MPPRRSGSFIGMAELKIMGSDVICCWSSDCLGKLNSKLELLMNVTDSVVNIFDYEASSNKNRTTKVIFLYIKCRLSFTESHWRSSLEG